MRPTYDLLPFKKVASKTKTGKNKSGTLERGTYIIYKNVMLRSQFLIKKHFCSFCIQYKMYTHTHTHGQCVVVFFTLLSLLLKINVGPTPKMMSQVQCWQWLVGLAGVNLPVRLFFFSLTTWPLKLYLQSKLAVG